MRAATLTDDAESRDGLDVAMEVRAQIARAEAAQFDALVSYATGEEHPAAGPWVRFAGSGTPAVPEFLAAEIGPALDMSPDAGRGLLADALDLTYRLPKLFDCLRDGAVDGWRVRKVAQATRKFTIAQAGDADRRLSHHSADGQPLLARVGLARLQRILDQIRIVDDPDDAETQRIEGRNRRSVSIWGEHGIARIAGTLSLDDGIRLDKRLDQIVECLRSLGDQRPHGVLRSVALGMLDEPDSLDDLYAQVAAAQADTGDEAAPADDTARADDTEPESPADEAETSDRPRTSDPDSRTDDASPRGAETPDAFTRPTRPTRTERGRRGLPATVLYVHFDRVWGTWALEGVGPITRSEAMDIVGHSQVTVKPVIDLEEVISSTSYVAPPRLKEQTALMNGLTCTFPHCNRPARVGDYDHIINHRDGGPTDSRNGHRLCRFHHRAKTFTAWTVTSPAPGVWLWASPGGRTYLVTGGTTTKLPGRITTPIASRRKRDAA